MLLRFKLNYTKICVKEVFKNTLCSFYLVSYCHSKINLVINGKEYTKKIISITQCSILLKNICSCSSATIQTLTLYMNNFLRVLIKEKVLYFMWSVVKKIVMEIKTCLHLIWFGYLFLTKLL